MIAASLHQNASEALRATTTGGARLHESHNPEGTPGRIGTSPRRIDRDDHLAARTPVTVAWLTPGTEAKRTEPGRDVAQPHRTARLCLRYHR